MIRVAFANADELVICGVTAILTAAHGTGIEVIGLTRSTGHRADIVLCDSFAREAPPGQYFADLVQDPRCGRVVVYTWNFEPWRVDEAFQMGASGYLFTGLCAAELIAALHSIHAGNPVVLPAVSPRGLGGGIWPGRREGLTVREAEVLSLIVMGLSNDEVAARMGLSINSVKSHIRSCYCRIGAGSRSQAVLWGLAHGFRSNLSGECSESDTRATLARRTAG